VDNHCRAKGVKFVSCAVDGVFARVFTDFGEQFEILDTNGEDTPELFIQDITTEENSLVTLLSGQKHNL
jgi:hypothetical protein